MEDDQIDDCYYGQVGWFHVTEVERLFNALQEENARFFFETHESGISGINPLVATHGGGFGQTAQVLVYVHMEDQEKFGRAFERAFVPDDKVDWRKKLREG